MTAKQIIRRVVFGEDVSVTAIPRPRNDIMAEFYDWTKCPCETTAADGVVMEPRVILDGRDVSRCLILRAITGRNGWVEVVLSEVGRPVRRLGRFFVNGVDSIIATTEDGNLATKRLHGHVVIVPATQKYCSEKDSY